MRDETFASLVDQDWHPEEHWHPENVRLFFLDTGYGTIRLAELIRCDRPRLQCQANNCH